MKIEWDQRVVMEDIPCAGCGRNIPFETMAHQVSYTHIHRPLDYYYCSEACRDRGLWQGRAGRTG